MVRIDEETKKMFLSRTANLLPEDKIIGYICASGGEANIATCITSAIYEIENDTTAYAGSIVFSASTLVLSSFSERIGFKDSKFLIHNTIPPPGTHRTEVFDTFELQMFDFMSKQLKKVSVSDLFRIAGLAKSFDVYQAKEIGLVNEIITNISSLEFLKTNKF